MLPVGSINTSIMYHDDDHIDIMDGTFPMESFTAAFRAAGNYPSQGKRSMHGGVPSRPTLARYAAITAIDFDPGKGSHLKSANMTVMATVVKLASQSEQSVPEIVAGAESATALRKQARREVLDRYPQAEEMLPEGTFTSPNYVFDVITALCAADYGVDPVEASDAHLDGTTRYLHL